MCFTFFVFITTTNPFNINLIKNIQKFKNIQTLLIVTCENTPKSITFITKDLQNDGSWINILDISNNTDISQVDFEKFFIRLSSTHIVVCSLKCNQSIRLLNKISKLKMFHYERNWLIFSESIDRAIGQYVE